ncbi:MAG: hypothetical protein IPN13_25035 [Bacteroidetes bacterium]|nr:hypothetical protein [Bacteroidota bacterium]
MRLHPDSSVPNDNPRPDYTLDMGTSQSTGNFSKHQMGISLHQNMVCFDELNVIVLEIIWIVSYCSGVSCFQPVDTIIIQTFVKFPIDIGQNPLSGITWYDHPAIPDLNDH